MKKLFYLMSVFMLTLFPACAEAFEWQDIKAVLCGVLGVFIIFVILPIVVIAIISCGIRTIRGWFDI